MGLNSKWTSHIKKKEDKKKFSSAVKSCSVVLDRLKEMLETDCEKSLAKISDDSMFTSPNLDDLIKSAVYERKVLRNIIDNYLQIGD